MKIKYTAIIMAGGTSSRYGHTNKLLEKVHGKEVIVHTVNAFLAIDEIEDIIITANFSIIDDLEKIFSGTCKIRIIEGGNTRQQSVYNGLKTCIDTDYVLIHDGARPMIKPDIIKKSIKMVQEKRALTVATRTIDTIKQVNENLKIIKTLDRSLLFNTQTPQVFRFDLIKEAHEKLAGENYTDDAGMLEAMGQDVYILEGNYSNIKITNKNDLEIIKSCKF